MPEDNNNPTPGAAPAAPPGSTTPAVTTPEPQAGDGQETISLEEARKLRKENQTLRARQKTIDDAEEQKRLAALSDVEKATKRADELQQKYEAKQKQLVTAHIKLAAQAKNIIDPDLAALAIADKLEYGEDGMPSNLEKALEQLIQDKPYLSKPAEAQPTTPAQQRPPTTPPMNPGRSTIQQPGQATLPRSQWPRLGDVLK